MVDQANPYGITQEMIDSKLAEVLWHGEPQEVFFFLRFVDNPNKFHVNEKFKTQRLPVWSAMSGKHMHTNARALLTLKPDVNVFNVEGMNPAMKAFKERHVGLGLMYLKAGTNLNARDADGNGLLKYGVNAGYADAVRVAIELGINVNQTQIEEKKDVNGKVIEKLVTGGLSCAIKNENWDVLKVLVEAGIDRNPENPAVREAIKIAEGLAWIDAKVGASLGRSEYKELEKTLKKKSQDFLQVIEKGVFPIELKFGGLCNNEEAFQKRLILLPKELQEKVLLNLGIERAWDIGQTDDERRRPFVFVKADEQLIFPEGKNIQALLDSALIAQIRNGKPQDVYMMLRLGANPNAKEAKGGKPALFAAVEENLMEIFIAQKKEEFERSAKYNDIEVTIPENLEESFIEWKDSAYHKTRILLEFGADPNTIHKGQKMAVIERAYGKTRLGIVKLLKKHGAKSVDGLLTYVAQVAEPEAIEEALEGIFLSEKQIKDEAFDALELAVKRNEPRMVKALQEKGLVPDKSSKMGAKIWHMVEPEHFSMVRSALEGHYSVQSQIRKKLTLEEKIQELSKSDLMRLTFLLDIGAGKVAQKNQNSSVGVDQNKSPEKKDSLFKKIGTFWQRVGGGRHQ